MEKGFLSSYSSKGSNNWFLEKISSLLLLLSALYIFFYFLFSYKITGLQFYLNLFFINLFNISILSIFMISGGLLSYLRFKAILDDYIKSSNTKMLLKIIFIGFSIFSFTFLFFTFTYFNFIISITTL